MNENSPQGVLRETDAEARRLARRLVRTARSAALACLDPETGHPLASRVAVSTDMTGEPLLITSRLSAHGPALAADGRCSLLFGLLGKGDPLAHARLSLIGEAKAVSREAEEYQRLRRRFLARNSKAELYIDFPDFSILRVRPTHASLNAGFGKAFELTPADFLEEVAEDIFAAETRVATHMNEDHFDALDRYAARAGSSLTGWRISTIDRLGFEMAVGDEVMRIEFPEAVNHGRGYRDAFVGLSRADAS